MEFEFTGKVWYWRGPSPYHFVTVPGAQSEDIKSIAEHVTYGWGMIPVTARIGRTVWTTAMYPKDGSYILPLKDMVRRAEGLAEGDEVTVWLEVTL